MAKMYAIDDGHEMTFDERIQLVVDELESILEEVEDFAAKDQSINAYTMKANLAWTVAQVAMLKSAMEGDE